MILINETGAYIICEMGIHWSFILISIQRDYSDRAYYGIPLVLRYVIFIVEITRVKFIVLVFYYLLTFLVEF